jgi:hypothetical protein
MALYQVGEIWRRLRARGYHRVAGGRARVEVRETVPGAEFRVRFLGSGSSVEDLRGTYAEVLAQVAALPPRRVGWWWRGE